MEPNKRAPSQGVAILHKKTEEHDGLSVFAIRIDQVYNLSMAFGSPHDTLVSLMDSKGKIIKIYMEERFDEALNELNRVGTFPVFHRIDRANPEVVINYAANVDKIQIIDVSLTTGETLLQTEAGVVPITETVDEAIGIWLNALNVRTI